MKKAIYFSIISGLCMAPMAFAHGPRGMGPGARAERFKEIDTNHDGSIDRAEHARHADDRFAAMDLDGDGRVTRDEAKESFKTEMRGHAMAHFDRLDANGDGQISRAEWDKHLDAMGARFEGEGKGERGARGPRGDKAECGFGRGGHGHGHGHGPGGGRFFERLDKNGDGAVDAAEHRAATDRRFAAADANGDGKLSQDEFMAPRHGKRDGKRDGKAKRRGKRRGKAPSGHGVPRR